MRRLLTFAPLVLLLTATPATAPAKAQTQAQAQAGTQAQAQARAADRVDRVAGALRESPLFVDPDVSYLLDARQRDALTRQIQAAGVPIYLAVVPLGSQDESAGDADYFTYLLHQRLRRNGIYLVSDQRGDLDWTAYQVPRDDTLDYDQAFNGKPLPQKLHDVIDAFARAPSAKPSDPVPPRTPEPDPGQKKTTTVGLAGQFSKTFFPSLIVSGMLLGLLWSVGLALLRLVLAARRRQPGSLRTRRLRRTAEAELARLARAIGRAGSDNPGYARAMADYDAAKLLYDEKTDPGSRFAIIVLSLEGQDALATESAEPRPRCVVNPFHGASHQRVRRRLPDLPEARRPLCDACERTATRLRPLTLQIDGDRRPYYLAPGLWEKNKGRTDNLPERVLEYLGVE
jgi:hypothetical protein